MWPRLSSDRAQRRTVALWLYPVIAISIVLIAALLPNGAMGATGRGSEPPTSAMSSRSIPSARTVISRSCAPDTSNCITSARPPAIPIYDWRDRTSVIYADAVIRSGRLAESRVSLRGRVGQISRTRTSCVPLGPIREKSQVFDRISTFLVVGRDRSAQVRGSALRGGSTRADHALEPFRVARIQPTWA